MRYTRLAGIALVSTLIAVSCVKKTYDIPTDSSKYDPHTPTNATLGDLSAIALDMNTGTSRVLGDTVVYGIVVGDDKSGNIYKKIIIEDSAGHGMSIIIDKTYLYGDYPVGRKIYLKTNGLFITNYKGVPEITYSVNVDGSTNGIPSILISDYIVKASYPHIIVPKEVTATDLGSGGSKYVNTLVKLKNMQFDNSSANVMYSLATSSTNRTITDCSRTLKLTMYNSNYASWHSSITPNGNGSIVGIATLYLSTVEFILRDTTDVIFTGQRCP